MIWGIIYCYNCGEEHYIECVDKNDEIDHPCPNCDSHETIFKPDNKEVK